MHPGLPPSALQLPEPGCSAVPHEDLQTPPERKAGSPVSPALELGLGLGLGQVLSGEALTRFYFILLCKAGAQEQLQWQRGSQLTRGETWSRPVPCESCCMRSRARSAPAAT